MKNDGFGIVAQGAYYLSKKVEFNTNEGLSVAGVPISFASILSFVGVMGGPLGVMGGAALGAAIDTAIGSRGKRRARRKMRRAFTAMILKRYHTQIFISALERLGGAMMHLVELRVKPGTKQFDELLKRNTYMDIGYKGNCSIDLLEPEETVSWGGKPIATIENGVITSYGFTGDPTLGKKWNEACKQLHLAALTAWAEEKKLDILEERERQNASAESRRKTATRFMVNGGIILVLLGYSIRRKRKLREE